MSAHQTLLAEAVAHGLDDGWEQANRIARQPTREQRMDALFAGVMRRITDLVEGSKQWEWVVMPMLLIYIAAKMK